MESMYDGGFVNGWTYVRCGGVTQRRELAVKAIKEYLNSPDGYNLLIKNCEHFARQEESYQVTLGMFTAPSAAISGLVWYDGYVAFQNMGWFTRWMTGAVAPSLASYIAPVLGGYLAIGTLIHLSEGWTRASVPDVEEWEIAVALKKIQKCIAQDELKDEMDRLVRENESLLVEIETIKKKIKELKSANLFTRLKDWLSGEQENKKREMKIKRDKINANDVQRDMLLKKFQRNMWKIKRKK